jgi:hypothetical protein
MGFNIQINECKGCGQQKPIVNKKYKFCPDCNRERLDSQKSEDQIAKAKNRVKGINKQTSETAEIQKLYKEECDRRVDEVDQVCTGCGQRNHLSNSHIYPRSKCRATKRLHLIYEPNNLTYHCVAFSLIPGANGMGCHYIYEGANRKDLLVKMFDYEKNVAYLEEIDAKYAKKFKI